MLSKETIRSHFHNALKKVINSAGIIIDDDEEFEVYGLDSLDRMNLLLEMEERTGYDLGELDLDTSNTFNLLYEEIARHASKH